MGLGEAIAVGKAVKDNAPAALRVIQWIRNRVYPKPPLKSVGFAIGIEIVDEECRGHIDEDFVRSVEKLLESSQLQKPIKLVRLPEPLVKKIKSDNDAYRALKKSHCVFIVYGKARSRTFDGKSHFVLDLESAVRHDEIAIERSQLLANEMANLLPHRTKISKDNDLTGFELNASTTHLGALYTIGTAAFLSNDLDFSQELFESLVQKMTSVSETGSPLEVQHALRYLRKNAIGNLAFIYLEKAEAYQKLWRKNRDIQHLEKMMEHVALSNKLVRESYRGAVLASLYFFVNDRNTKRARKVLVPRRMKSLADATASFDEAFFYAYDGRLSDAERCYKRAFTKPTNSAILVEIEEFLLWILSEEQAKVQFYFCLGLINYFGKEDFLQAEKDFSTFLDKTDDSTEFAKQRATASEYIEKISKTAG